MASPIQDLLCSLRICDPASVAPYFPRVRDLEDVSVLRCSVSGVIFLSRTDHLSSVHYESKDNFNYWGEATRQDSLLKTAEDDQRRARQFREVIAGKEWLDIGTGLGGILDILSPVAKKVSAVEPQAGARRCLQDLGYQVFQSVDEAPEDSFDVITLFHVFEHFSEPLEMLKKIKSLLRPGGKIIIEVPHAKDVLLSTFDCEAFKAFTLWSEHLILHTRQSLEIFLKEAGFRNISVEGFQRYPLANHLYWLAKGMPGGHVVWSQLRTPGLDVAYASFLSNTDQTDSLILTADV